MNYQVVIGMEVHVELHTESKLFCSCPNSFSSQPNTNVCEVCLGFPGTMPLLNSYAVKQALKACLALNCEVAMHSRFDRKNYFYPDIPKGYQISQYYIPLGSNGVMEIETESGQKRVGITRVHMEEDAGKLVHAPAGDYSMVDYNRAGVPLIEIVSEPDIRSSEEARLYLENLKSMMQYAGVSDCKMEEGSLRCDSNISLRPMGSTAYGSKVELKNMNSFRAVEKALEFEIDRQSKILDKGEEVIPQTRRWDETKEETILMRDKLEAHDYRCFVDPELAPVDLNISLIEETKSNMPEFAGEKIKRYVNEYGLPQYDAGVITADPDLANYFEECLQKYPHPKNLSNWLMGDFLSLVNAEGSDIKDVTFKPNYMVELLKLIDNGDISGKIGKEVLEKSFQSGKSPGNIVEEEGMQQISDESQLEEIVDRVIEDNPSSVNDYKSGKKKAMGYLVGQIMKATSGKANPQLVNELLQKKLDE